MTSGTLDLRVERQNREYINQTPALRCEGRRLWGMEVWGKRQKPGQLSHLIFFICQKVETSRNDSNCRNSADYYGIHWCNDSRLFFPGGQVHCIFRIWKLRKNSYWICNCFLFTMSLSLSINHPPPHLASKPWEQWHEDLFLSFSLTFVFVLFCGEFPTWRLQGHLDFLFANLTPGTKICIRESLAREAEPAVGGLHQYIYVSICLFMHLYPYLSLFTYQWAIYPSIYWFFFFNKELAYVIGSGSVKFIRQDPRFGRSQTSWNPWRGLRLFYTESHLLFLWKP